jgi:hypothetical protein
MHKESPLNPRPEAGIDRYKWSPGLNPSYDRGKSLIVSLIPVTYPSESLSGLETANTRPGRAEKPLVLILHNPSFSPSIQGASKNC